MTHRDHFNPQVGGLGQKVERTKEPAKDREVAPGVFIDKDGKRYTNLPLPPINPPTPPDSWPHGADMDVA